MTTQAAARPLRRIVLGITGGIAAYKAAELTRLLIKEAIAVDVVMTAAATQFISTGNAAITFGSTLNGASAVTVTTAGLTTFMGAVGNATPLTSSGPASRAPSASSPMATAMTCYRPCASHATVRFSWRRR